MSNRRRQNRIRGPQSALTDFLAANNISAAQIRSDYETRRRLAEGAIEGTDLGDQTQAADSNNVTISVSGDNDHDEIVDEEGRVAEVESVPVTKGKKKKEQKKGASQFKQDNKIKKVAKRKKSAAHDSDYDGDGGRPESIGNEIVKARPAPGQLEHCEICNKRFTVTPYSKNGPGGGLLCAPCSKQLSNDNKPKDRPINKAQGRRRRKLESERLDGIVGGGAKSLQLLCIQKLAEHHEEIEELGDISQLALERLAEIFAKRRVLKSNTLPLFLRPDRDSVIIHDAAYLEVDDYRQIFAVVPDMTKLVLSNACQLKDEVIEYMIERCKNLQHLQLYAANLVSDQMWQRLFSVGGRGFLVIKLKWLDASFDDDTVQGIINQCPSLERLKLEMCRKIGDAAVRAISEAPNLKHISLLMSQEVSNATLMDLIKARGPSLQTLSLRKFTDADDLTMEAIHEHCSKLRKLRFTENDMVADAAYVKLFANWQNPPLEYIDFSGTRDINNSDPDGPGDAIGVASGAFKALMSHSGSALRHLDISSCRHIDLRAFMDVFNGSELYSNLEHINISFCNRADTSVVAGIFRSCPALKKLIAFGCFNVHNVVVPRNIALIGVPTAQDAIEQFGVGIAVDEAIGRMIEVGI